MKLDIVLPSKWRQEKLDKCLNSVFHSVSNIQDHDIQLYIYFSVQEEYQHYWNHFCAIGNIHLKFIEEYRVPDFWNSHLRSTGADAVCYINDDIEFYEDTARVILEEFPKKFPDYDGVMGLVQANLPQEQAVEGAFGVIGKKYSQRFPNQQVFCPDYDRFYGDWELWQYAKSIDKFYFCQQARIQHHHPITNKALEDETHKDVRLHLPKDRQTFQTRKGKGFLWGRSFDLITF